MSKPWHRIQRDTAVTSASSERLRDALTDCATCETTEGDEPATLSTVQMIVDRFLGR